MAEQMASSEMDREDLYFYLQKRYRDISPEDLDKLTEEVWSRMYPEEKNMKVLCPVCGKPIHIDDYGGEDKQGSYHKKCIVQKYKDGHIEIEEEK